MYIFIILLIVVLIIGYKIYNKKHFSKHFDDIWEIYGKSDFELFKDYVHSGFPELNDSEKSSILYNRESMQYWSNNMCNHSTEEMDRILKEISNIKS